VEIWFTPEAGADVVAAVEWYRRSCRGTDERFLAALDQSLDAIRTAPAACPRVHGLVRRRLLRGFPYALFYFEEAGRLNVLGCLHAATES
jgi:plasmid stabilization system protein ParE